MRAYYNDNDRHCAAWLRNLIAAGRLPEGDVDERSIAEVQPGEFVSATMSLRPEATPREASL